MGKLIGTIAPVLVSHSYLNKEVSKMLRSEFDYLMETYGQDPKEISQEDYGLIDYVYTWYPDDVMDKEMIVFLVCKFGMKMIADMIGRAYAAERADLRRRSNGEE